MYASVRSYRVDPGSVGEIMRRVDEEFAPTLSREPGFVSYQVIDTGEESLVTVTVFHDEAGVEASVMKAAEFVRDRLSDMDIERVDAKSGSIGVSLATDEVLEPAHV